MLITHRPASLRIISCLSLVVELTVGGGAAHAQQLSAAPDGQQFQNQSAATQRDFVGTFGQSCAPREWVWQHSLAVNPDDFNGDLAADGQSFGNQDDDIQRAFVAWFGLQASMEWVAEHNSIVGHKVLLGNIAPVPCPPAAAPITAAYQIATRHLADAVNAAKAGDNASAADLFDGFQSIWTAAKPALTQKSPEQAQAVQTAFDQVTALKGKSGVQTQVLPALQNLLKVVNDANASVGH
jgi:hypothetical protein